METKNIKGLKPFIIANSIYGIQKTDGDLAGTGTSSSEYVNLFYHVTNFILDCRNAYVYVNII
jgi:hypothetical protein